MSFSSLFVSFQVYEFMLAGDLSLSLLHSVSPRSSSRNRNFPPTCLRPWIRKSTSSKASLWRAAFPRPATSSGKITPFSQTSQAQRGWVCHTRAHTHIRAGTNTKARWWLHHPVCVAVFEWAAFLIFLDRSLAGKLRIGLAEQSVLSALSQAVCLTPAGQGNLQPLE